MTSLAYNVWLGSRRGEDKATLYLLCIFLAVGEGIVWNFPLFESLCTGTAPDLDWRKKDLIFQNVLLITFMRFVI